MKVLLDTNIAIRLRDGDASIGSRLAALPGTSMLSVVTRVELEGGVYKDMRQAGLRRARTDRILAAFQELPFGAKEATAYAAIVETCGFSRTRILDRMIAATAIVSGATLITMNPRDFAEVPGLALEDWT